MRRRLAVLGLAWAMLLGPGWAVRAAGAAEPAESLPEPDLSHLERGVQEQLVASRERLARALAASDNEPGAVAAAYGELGELYYLYDLTAAAEPLFLRAAERQPDEFRWHYFLAVLRMLDGRPQAALQDLERALALRPGDLPSLLRQGEARLLAGDAAGAEASYRAALERAPDSAAAEYGLGRIQYDRGELEAAVERFERALELQPQATSIHHSLGMAYRGLGDLEQARDQLARNRGDRVRFPDPLVEGLAARLESDQVYFQAAVEALKRGELEAAVAGFRRALEEKPDDHLIHYNLALALLRQGDREGAARELRRALEVEPDFRNGHYNLALMLAEDGRLEEAEHHFRRAHEVDPEDGVAHLEWATALSRLGRISEAERELERLLAAEPGNAAAMLNLGLLKAQRGQRQSAQELLTRALELDAEPAEQAAGHLRLGALLEEGGDRERAIGSYRRAVELAPDDGAARSALARALGRAGRFDEAADQFSELVARRPEEAEPHFGRAMARLLGGDYGKARSELEASVQQLPGSQPLVHLLARLLATSPDPGVRDGERALELAGRVFQQRQTLEHAETVAMALAEVGRYQEAVDLQARVVGEAERAGGPAAAADARRRLELYRQGRPCRAPWESG